MVARELTLDEKHILDQRRLKEVKGKNREYERERRVPFITLVPHDMLASFLKCDRKISPSTIEPLTAFFARSSIRPGASKCVIDTLRHLSRQPEFIEAISGNTLSLCLQAFVHFGEFESFKAAVTDYQSTLPISFFEWLRGWVVASPDKVLERFTNIREGASLAIPSCECLADQFKSITQLVPPASKDSAGGVETPKPMLDWAQEMTQSCLDSMGSGNLGHEAGSLLADVSLYFSDPFAFLEETALPKFRGMSNLLAFHLKLLNQLWNLKVKEGLPEKKYSHLFKETSRWLIETADFAQLSGEKSKAVNQDELENEVKDVVMTNFLVNLINRSTNSDDVVSLFASKIVADAPRFQATELLTLWMPLLYKVHGKLINDKIPLDTPCYQQLCSALVKSLIDNFVGPAPVDTESQARGSVSCSCVYCTQLNEFLADSSQSVGTLPIVRTEREHLKDELKSAGIDCKCEAVPGDSPCTLMTKAPSSQHVENCEAWVNRKKTAYDLLMKVEKSHLEQLLGPDYSHFLDLQREVDPSTAPQPVVVAKAKRKVSDTDIVDLGRGKKKNFKITSFFTKK
ncbi:Fe2OG dioxygenase domain-containing protein [Fusarium sp. LHS14.1]|nr:Fe2OG dioxygenase domain-containing protein [Fusarium sp. LHS14.1]